MRRLSTTLLVMPGLVFTLHGGSISVDLGGSADPRALAVGEAEVVWGDADPTDDTRCTLAFAAVELQRYLAALDSTGEAWQIVDGQASTDARSVRLRIAGPQDDTDLGSEGYRLSQEDTGNGWRVTVTGGSRIGVLYGAYDLLHRLGVRWYAPGEMHKEVPQRDLSSLPELDVTTRPAFVLRGFHAWENRGNEDFLLWMARNRLNYWCVQQDNKPLMHKLGIHLIGGGHRLTAWYLGPTTPYPYDHPRVQGDEGKPPDPYPVSDEFQGDADGNGALSYFEAHPEWYALRDGKRSPRIHGDGGDNFCTSNPHAMTEWVKNSVSDLAEGRNRDATLMNAWMLDVGKWCQCESCQAQGTRTDRNLQVVHRYAQGIKSAQRDGRINRPIRLLFLAYADVLEPPSKPLPADFDYSMCIATYFPITRCYVHQLDEPDCPRNSRYMRHLQGWAVDPKRHYRGQLCIGEYYNVSGYKSLPICFMHTMQADIPTYYQLGARYFHYMHCTTENWGNKALTNWQMARQLWDPQVDCETLWNDYFQGRYGPAANEMRRFYESLERMLCNVTELKYNLARRLDRNAETLYPGGHLRYQSKENDSDIPSLLDMLAAASQCRQIIDTLLDRDLPERIRARIAEDERLFTYGERTLTYFDLATRAYRAVREERLADARDLFRKLVTVADTLRADTTSTRFASSHANAPNAFAATYATGVLGHLEKVLGPVAPDTVPVFDPDGPPLVLTHRELRGGGALRYTYGFKAYPAQTELSASGNVVYGNGTAPHDVIRSWVDLRNRGDQDIVLTLTGALTPIHGENSIPGRITVNGHMLFEGPMPFVEGTLTRYWVIIPADILQAGSNRIEIRNIHSEGRIGNRPWFGIDRLELSTEPPQDAAPMPAGGT